MKEIGRSYDRFKIALAYPQRLLRTKARLLAEADALKGENDDLRARLVAAQQLRVQAQNQADDLRKEKERLRARVAELKLEVEGLRKINGQLGDRIAELTAENEALTPHASTDPRADEA